MHKWHLPHFEDARTYQVTDERTDQVMQILRYVQLVEYCVQFRILWCCNTASQAESVMVAEIDIFKVIGDDVIEIKSFVKSLFFRICSYILCSLTPSFYLNVVVYTASQAQYGIAGRISACWNRHLQGKWKRSDWKQEFMRMFLSVLLNMIWFR